MCIVSHYISLNEDTLKPVLQTQTQLDYNTYITKGGYMYYRISYSCVSHIGKIRKINQDNIICDRCFMEVTDANIPFHLSGTRLSKSFSLFGIFDGMGGEECGEMASYIAAKNASTLEIGKDVVLDLSQFCEKTNTDICTYAKMNNVSAMGTTAAILAFTRKGVTLCNIGDSKIFRFFDGILEQISRDHIAVSAYRAKPPLSQNLGIPPSELIIDPYLARGGYNDGDIYLICSDGLTDMVTTEEITQILSSKSITDAIDELLDKALTYGGRDNISIILCKVEHKPKWFSKWRNHTHKKEA